MLPWADPLTGGGRLVCTVRSTYHTDNLSKLLAHIWLFHAHQPSITIRCRIGGCQRTFQNFGTFQNHISAYHRKETNPTNIVALLYTETVWGIMGETVLQMMRTTMTQTKMRVMRKMMNNRATPAVVKTGAPRLDPTWWRPQHCFFWSWRRATDLPKQLFKASLKEPQLSVRLN